MKYYIYEWLNNSKRWVQVGFTFSEEIAKCSVSELKKRYPLDNFKIECELNFKECIE